MSKSDHYNYVYRDEARDLVKQEVRHNSCSLYRVLGNFRG